ncbi:hypothetical protein K490DRAFT_75484 [Saccharata proteae CBS 121410]|uniref:Altered inheritance of mitochondria protein 21 n=1 Tax=Saccharata proteae CBS 121410 TaxID=1314787 RepID=A0A9P4HTI0_9PEZI|nr:hypothetical protein K490DRAFT_75484 [Saccharata proteae CBS 121410]
MAAPSIPQRPARSQQQQNPAAPLPTMNVPQIPPRPKRSVDRSVSPNRDSFARSPLNDISFVNGKSTNPKRLSVSDTPARPPSVTLPTLGQEGSEYANFATPPPEAEESVPEQTRDAEGLKLYAPRAEVPQSTAKSRIATVTRTDSSQAAAAGFGRLSEAETKAAGSFRTGSSGGGSTRPQSIHQDDEEHGIPEIGLQVPMYPNAGDVQAPTPSPYGSAPATGVGFFNKGDQPTSRHHGRNKSAQQDFHGPPGSYGRHGHGVAPQDAFERDWYAKHPQDAAREAQGEYGPAISENRKEWAMSSDDLNRLVQDSASRGIGMGTSPGVVGTPAEEIGYKASEEYASRMASPRPQSRPPSIATQNKERPRSSQTHAESPLRKMSFPIDEYGTKQSRENAVEDDEGVVHVDPPAHARSKIHGGGPEAENLGPEGGNTEEEGGFITERGPGAPILASDEIERHKTPGAEYMQPAVSPMLQRDGAHDDHNGRRSSSRPTSRPTSAAGLSRWRSHDDHERTGTGTPLDDVREYEPLFPDEEEEAKQSEKPVTAADKLKRPELARHHFPSQDVWEDAPSSLQYTTEVETPEVPEDKDSAPSNQLSQVFEKPEDEAARKNQIEPSDQTSFLPEHTRRLAKSHLNKDVLSDMTTRPGMQHRFPSQDIWEDTPSELQLVTTVNGPQSDETAESPSDIKSPTDAPKPSIPARPARTKEITQEESSSKQASPTDPIKKVPSIPDRPKPQIPNRPARPVGVQRDSSEHIPLSKTNSAGSTNNADVKSPPPPVEGKPKPPVPSKVGGKIAALRGNFLNDLNSRLQLGPMAPPKPAAKEEKEEEKEEEEKAPLADARKGRARGPARRRPAAAGAAAAAPAEGSKEEKAVAKWGIAEMRVVWSIDGDEGRLDVPVPASGSSDSTLAPHQPAPVEEQEQEPEPAKVQINTQVPDEPLPAPVSEPVAHSEAAVVDTETITISKANHYVRYRPIPSQPHVLKRILVNVEMKKPPDNSSRRSISRVKEVR